MKIFSKALFASFLTLLLGFNQAFASEEWSPEVWSMFNNPYVVNILSQSEGDMIYGGNLGSLLQYNLPTTSGSTPIQCKKYGDEICTSERLKNLQASFIMPVCKEGVSTWCLNNFQVFNESGTAISTQFVRYINGDTYPGDSSIGLPEGGTISLWRVDYPSKESPTIFALKFGGWGVWTLGKPFFFQTSGSIFPIKILLDSQFKADERIQTPNGGISHKINGVQCKNILFKSDGECGSVVAFPDGLRFSASFTVPDIVTGFISSRTDNPKIESKIASGSNKTISIEGGALSIPRFGKSLTLTEAKYLMGANLGGGNAVNWLALDNDQSGSTYKKFELLRNLASDKASGEWHVWNFATLDSSNDSQRGVDVNGKPRIDYSKQCNIPRSDLLGFVSTNAMVVDPGPPNFIDDQFVYNLAGMHFKSDGATVQQGYYSLIISKQLASCLYKTQGVPIRAAISISHGDGEEAQVSTEAVKDLGSYYSLHIAGFTFSNPTVKVRYEFKADAPKVVPAAPRKVVITCLKGKIIKKVSGLEPKCPKGFKKK